MEVRNRMTQYTAEVEFGMPEPNTGSKFYATAESPEEATSRAVDYVPSVGTVFRVGVWTGSRDERPESGHENGLL